MKKQLLIIYFSILAIIICSCTSDSDKFSQMSEGSGENYARINIEHYGNIDLRLFSAKEPLLVERFIQNIDSDLYVNSTLNTFVNDYYLSFGPEKADKLSSSYTQSDDLHPFYGALAVNLKNGELQDPSSFILITVTEDELTNITSLLDYKGNTMRQYLEAGYGVCMTEQELLQFYTYGGAPWLEGHCAVFGQIYDGFDVLSTILSDLQAGKDPQDIRIQNIEYR